MKSFMERFKSFVKGKRGGLDMKSFMERLKFIPKHEVIEQLEDCANEIRERISVLQSLLKEHEDEITELKEDDGIEGISFIPNNKTEFGICPKCDLEMITEMICPKCGRRA